MKYLLFFIYFLCFASYGQDTLASMKETRRYAGVCCSKTFYLDIEISAKEMRKVKEVSINNLEFQLKLKASDFNKNGEKYLAHIEYLESSTSRNDENIQVTVTGCLPEQVSKGYNENAKVNFVYKRKRKNKSGFVRLKSETLAMP